jgi:hypothetical protein
VPVTYQFDRELRLIRTKCAGEVTLEEVVSHFRELELDAAITTRPDVLIDLTEMRSIPRADQLMSAAGEVESLQPQLQWGSCAIVASRDVLFGMSRVFRVFVEEHFADSSVFRALDEAERWLAARRPPVA